MRKWHELCNTMTCRDANGLGPGPELGVSQPPKLEPVLTRNLLRGSGSSYGFRFSVLILDPCFDQDYFINFSFG